jgi:hypothetical protein
MLPRLVSSRLSGLSRRGVRLAALAVWGKADQSDGADPLEGCVYPFAPLGAHGRCLLFVIALQLSDIRTSPTKGPAAGSLHGPRPREAAEAALGPGEVQWDPVKGP